MGAFLGGVASVFYGVADFLGGEGAKRVGASSVVLWSGVVSFPLIAVGALVVGGEAATSDFLLGAMSGACGAVGLVFLFAGLSRGRAAAVAPASAAIGGVFPVVVAVLLGERPSTLAWLGIALAIPAIVLCSWVGDVGGAGIGGIGYGLVAGLGFGAYTTIIDRTGEASALLPLITARGAAMLTVLAISAFGAWSVVRPGVVPWRIVAANGMLDVAGNVALIIALRAGTLALVAVAASLYPAITVILARLVNGEHLRPHRTAGLAATLVALAAISLG